MFFILRYINPGIKEIKNATKVDIKKGSMLKIWSSIVSFYLIFE